MFAALVPPEHAVEDLAEFLAPRQEAGPGFRWTVPEQWHVTLAFMGSVTDRRSTTSSSGSDAPPRAGRPSTSPWSAAGRSPTRPARRCCSPRSTPTAARGLRHLAVGTRAAATKAGADAEGGRFHPHVTLARIGRPAEVTRWLRVLGAYRGPTWRATEVALIESHLGEGPRRRPRYEKVGSFALGQETPA